MHNLKFNTSAFVRISRRYVASLSIALAFLLTVHVYSGYHRTLGHSLGIPSLHCNTFYTVANDAYVNIQRMLQEICEYYKGRDEGNARRELGSWQNAITAADGCWLTRGHFSQNFTFIVKNYLEEHQFLIWPPLHAWK